MTIIVNIGAIVFVLWWYHWNKVMEKENEHTRALVRGVHRRLDGIEASLNNQEKRS